MVGSKPREERVDHVVREEGDGGAVIEGNVGTMSLFWMLDLSAPV